MTKGSKIRQLIQQGWQDDAQIAALSGSTVNSVRWHRSKMKAGSSLSTPTGVKRGQTATGKTVGEVASERGYGFTLTKAVEKLLPGRDENIASALKALGQWNFVLNGTVTSRFGQCNYRARTIEVHEKLLDLEDDFRTTFLHECAHALDMILNGRSSKHGYPWQRIMMAMGLPPRRCGDHTEEAADAIRSLRATRGRAPAEYWKCNRCGAIHPIKVRRQYPAEMYTHPKCGGNFSLYTPEN